MCWELTVNYACIQYQMGSVSPGIRLDLLVLPSMREV